MEPVTYRARPSSNSSAILGIVLVMMPTSYTLYKIYDTGWEGIVILFSELDRGPLIALFGIILIVLIVPFSLFLIFIEFPKKPGPEFNFLQIDQSGLNYMRHGKSRFWAWKELSGFRLVSRNDRIEFVLPVADLKAAKRDPWVHEITLHGRPIAVIGDVYDASLDEIVATLNAYRQQAIE